MDLPSETALRWLVTRYARLRAAHGEAIGAPELVQPTGDCFPDEFAATPEGVETLLARVVSYAPVADDLAIALAFVDDGSAGGGGGCGTGGCGTGGGGGSGGSTKDASCTDSRAAGAAIALPSGVAVETAEGYVIPLAIGDVGHPVTLTAALARGTAGIALFEAGERVPPAERAAMSEVMAHVSGFGVLLTNAAYVYAKGCGGARVRQATELSIEEHAVLLALFTRLHEKPASAARAHLDTTQREAFADALRWVDSNRALVRALEDHPESLA